MSYSSTSSRWFAQDDREKMSLDDFQASVNAHISSIELTYYALQQAYEPFVSSKGILPFHCRKAIRLILALNTELHQCGQFLREIQTMPNIVIALRYPLLDDIHYLKEQADKLISYLYDMSSPQYSASLRNYIRELFGDLLPLVADIPYHVRFLFDEACFQERRSDAGLKLIS